MMKIMIQKIADGFDTQRGAVFRIETHANDDTGSVMKISISKDEEIKTTVHNLAEERNVYRQSEQLVKNERQKEYGWRVFQEK